MILTLSRTPAARSASIVVFIEGIVTVSSADRQTRFGRCASVPHPRNGPRGTSAPRSSDLETAAFQHGRDDVLADIVQIALDRADGDASGWLCAARRQQRPDQLQRRPSWRAQPAAAPARSNPRTRSGGPPRPWRAPWPCPPDRARPRRRRATCASPQQPPWHFHSKWHRTNQTCCNTPLNSLTASSMAAMFATGVRACTLWMVLKTNPPSRAKISQRSSTWRRHLVRRAERKHLLRVHAAAPESELSAVNRLSGAPAHPHRRTLHRVENVEPGFDEGRDERSTEPQECLKHFQPVWRWIQSLRRW